jgi:transcriptional regulator with XRE-family HTH domain
VQRFFEVQDMVKKKPRHFIKEWRKHRGLTQEMLAERMGIVRSYISHIENGKRRYDQFFLEAAADALACQPADLIMRDPTAPSALWSIWDQIPAEKQAIVMDMVEGLVKGPAKKTGTHG